ncbi:MAG: hypothetical protein FJ279_36870, partial [Planctomycetes bacterium]|nr:hypothetical protein [Planctomycetota bacterium]
MPHRAAESAEERQGRLAKGLRAVVDIGDELILAPSLDALYRRAVELAREKLGLERCALFVEEGPSVRGTYGTDAQGKTTDERSFSFLKDEKWTRHFSPKPPTAQRWDLRERALEYWDGEKVVRVGYGWVAVTPITGSSGRPVAVLCNDPGTTGAKADPDQQDLVA